MKQTVESIEKSSRNSKKIGCVIMASGLSVRFGANKLLQEFLGETLIQRILNTTAGELFAKRVVVTRTPEVVEICRTQGVDVIFHELPGRNDVVRLGVEHLREMDGIVFTPCDQPLLRRETFAEMVAWRDLQEDVILRAAFGERVGTPIFFGSDYFAELCNLPQSKGGAMVAKRHPEKVQYLGVKDEAELQDIDTPADLENLLRLQCKE